MQLPTPSPEHHWLLQLVGNWTYEHDCVMGPDQPPIKSTGRQSTQALGEMWILCEMVGPMPDGQESRSLITLGYNPAKERFVGSFVSSCMAHLWPYEGTLDPAKRVLTLDSEGPNFAGDGTMAKYQDIIEWVDANHYTMASQVLMPDGKWVRFMNGLFTRV